MVQVVLLIATQVAVVWSVRLTTLEICRRLSKHSDVEVKVFDYICYYLVKSPTQSFAGAQWYSTYYIGLKQIDKLDENNGHWHWIHSNKTIGPLLPKGPDIWGQSPTCCYDRNPDNAWNEQDCGSIWKEARGLDDITCAGFFPYICELALFG